jgi:hypothetical protein
MHIQANTTVPKIYHLGCLTRRASKVTYFKKRLNHKPNILTDGSVYLLSTLQLAHTYIHEYLGSTSDEFLIMTHSTLQTPIEMASISPRKPFT